MGFKDILSQIVKPKNKLESQVKSMQYFFVHECGWSQQDFEEAEVEFMNEIISEHVKINKKRKK